MRRLLKLLYPGLGVKRWLLLMGIGLFAVIASVLALILGLPGLKGLAEVIYQKTVAIFGTGPWGLLLLLATGLAIILYSGYRFLHSLLRDFAPGEKAVDALYQSRYLKRGPKVVVIGGGTGLSTLLRGLKEYTSNITAVVTVADDGGSSGKLRGELGMPPPGDIRNCLVALADTEPLLETLFQYRFKSGDSLSGHSFGNLFLAAMSQILGFKDAIKASGKVLAIRGKVLPVTEENIKLKAICKDGREILGESNIGGTLGAIRRLELVPGDCKALPEVLAAIASAEAIVVGPGSLYTSLLPNLLVGGVAEAIAASKAVKMYVCNIMTQIQETHSFSAADHLEVIYEHVGPNLFDYIIVNNQPIGAELLQRYAEEGAEPVKIDWDQLRRLQVRVLAADLLQPGQVAWHNPRALARIVLTKIASQSHQTSRFLDNLLLEAQLGKISRE